MRYYQIRLKRGQPFHGLIRKVTEGFEKALRNEAEFPALDGRALESVSRELETAARHFARAQDVCGYQGICEENLSPAAWNMSPDPELGVRLPWNSEEITRFRLEVDEDLIEFSDALVAAFLRAVTRSPKQASHAKSLKAALEPVVREAFGAHLYENPACGECMLCQEAAPIKPQPL